MKAISKIIAQYLLSLLFAILLILITELSFWIQSHIGIGTGFDFVLVSIIAGFIFSVLLYRLTGSLPAQWKVTSYLITLIMWAAELYFISDFFSDLVFQSEFDTYFVIIVLSALLWVSNKMVVDAVLTKLRNKKV